MIVIKIYQSLIIIFFNILVNKQEIYDKSMMDNQNKLSDFLNSDSESSENISKVFKSGFLNEIENNFKKIKYRIIRFSL